jgi:hypothetical protein
MSGLSHAVERPCIVSDMPADAYHADPCPFPSLSAGGAVILDRQCPKALWWNSRMNPAFEPVTRDIFDFGTAAHLLLLEPQFDERLAVIDAPDWRTNAAKDAREAARIDGKIPLLTKHAEIVRWMRDAMMDHPACAEAFTAPGVNEQSHFWIDQETGVWCRSRPDRAVSPRWLVDYKTAASANPSDFGRTAFKLGYHQRAAWYLDGWEALTGETETEYLFVLQEKEAPFLVAPIRLHPDDILHGRRANREALRTFARCLERNHWPDYGEAVHTVELPHYARIQMTDREFVADRRKPTITPEMNRRAIAAQAPYEGEAS